MKTRLNAFNFVHLDLNFFSLLLWTSLTIWIGKAIEMITSGTTEVAAIGKTINISVENTLKKFIFT